MKICKYCLQERPDESFEVCRILGDKVYRRLRCQMCKRSCTNQRRRRLRSWLEEDKRTLACVRCGFSDFRALEFHHSERDEKDFNVGDMLRSGHSIELIRREIDKCIVLCSNCHQIEHYDKLAARRKRREPVTD